VAAYRYGLAAKSNVMGLVRLEVGTPASAASWTGSTGYSFGDFVRPTTPNGWVYKCIGAGTSNSGEPTWPTAFAESVDDNTATWEAYSKGVKLRLHTTSHTPDQDADQFISDLDNELASGNGYTSGGELVLDTGAGNGKLDLTYTGATNKLNVDFDDVTWSFTGTKAFVYAILVVDLGVDSISPLIGYDNMGSQSVTDADFTYQVNANGFLEVTAT